MDPIITQWNSEWVTGPGGVVFLMQEQNEARCVVHAPCRKMLEWLLAPDGVWLEGSLGSGVRQEYFPAEHVSLSSGGDLQRCYFALLCIDVKCRCEGRFFFSVFVFPALSRSRCCPFVWHLPTLYERCVCWYSSSISLPLSHYASWSSGDGMLSGIDQQPVECSVDPIAAHRSAVRHLFKETHGGSWQISEHLSWTFLIH